MAVFRNQDYLLNEQYKDGSNFNARVELHRRFSTNTSGWHPWVFDQLKLDEGCKLLELGCGPGFLWRGNRQRIPASWQITLSDFSAGMLAETRQQLGEERFAYQVADAQALPFDNASFDAVIANHMLYHIPNLAQALGEIQRVLKPNGRFYASTIGSEHMHELDALLAQAAYSPAWQNFKHNAPFTLENGEKVLAPFFSQIKLHLYEDALEITEAEPLIAYALSGRLGQTDDSDKRAVLQALIEQDLAAHGVLHITKASGMFVAQKG
jgi:ubiquinone/menaquinone biosynthesis C-methylase UbiE